MHWCSQQRGRPGVPLEAYSERDLEREYRTVKVCAPFCTVGCVHRVAELDRLREQPLETLSEWFAPQSGMGPPPPSVKLLRWMFVTGRPRRIFRRAAARLFGVA